MARLADSTRQRLPEFSFETESAAEENIEGKVAWLEGRGYRAIPCDALSFDPRGAGADSRFYEKHLGAGWRLTVSITREVEDGTLLVHHLFYTSKGRFSILAPLRNRNEFNAFFRAFEPPSNFDAKR